MVRKAIKGILLGYDHNEGYRILSEENKLIRSRDHLRRENIDSEERNK